MNARPTISSPSTPLRPAPLQRFELMDLGLACATISFPVNVRCAVLLAELVRSRRPSAHSVALSVPSDGKDPRG
jgi:hypothetical protein